MDDGNPLLFEQQSLTGRVALVTGGSRGIGRAIAVRLAEAGAAVAVNYHANEQLAAEVVAEIRAHGGQAIAVQGNVACYDDVVRMRDRTVEAFGGLDLLINNAGVLKPQLLMLAKLDEVKSVLDTNLMGSIHAIKVAVPSMVDKRFGRIVNISSVAGLRGLPGQGSYAASKAGMHGMTVVLAKELGRFGITVNSVAPGFIKTDMTAIFTPKVEQGYLSDIPLHRFGEAEEVANLVTFLCSDLAGYITGTVIPIDGGLAS